MAIKEHIKFVDEDELMRLGSDAMVEVVDGEIVEMAAVGILHHFIVGNLYHILDTWVRALETGFIFPDGLLFHLFREGKRIKGSRVPDLSFVRKGSIPKGWNIERPFPGAPALAIEVMSPDDSSEEVLKKVREYLAAGSEQVWVVYPQPRELHQFRRGVSDVRTYTGSETIDVDTLFPG
ncbi:MAG: Uma2 family endonuclease, partial [Burkholderiales bacterium]|nr:Uma2 family endonuclease [Anaerolineae bacterium]